MAVKINQEHEKLKARSLALFDEIISTEYAESIEFHFYADINTFPTVEYRVKRSVVVKSDD